MAISTSVVCKSTLRWLLLPPYCLTLCSCAEDATLEASAEELGLRQLLSSRAEISVCLEAPVPRGFVPAAPLSTAAKARALSDLALQELQVALQQQPNLPQAKNRYGVDGCEGPPPSLRPLPDDIAAAVQAVTAAATATDKEQSPLDPH